MVTCLDVISAICLTVTCSCRTNPCHLPRSLLYPSPLPFTLGHNQSHTVLLPKKKKIVDISSRQVISGLTNTQRRGWIARGIPSEASETVAEHSQAVAAYCISYAADAIQSRATEIAAAHDVAEAIAGDVIPADNITKPDKRMKEELAYLFLKSVDPTAGKRLHDLWNEYEENTTEAAKFVHDVDKLQRLDRAFQYAREYPSLDLNDFKSDAAAIKNAELAAAAQDVLRKWDAWDQNNQVFLFVTGGPGVGKGTQCSKAVATLGSLHISAGELLRDEQKRAGSPFTDFITQSFENSVPVPPQLVISLIQNATRESSSKIVLLDGFPLTEQQLRSFETEVSIKFGTISLVAEPEKLKERLQERAKSSGRADDEPERIIKRVDAFVNRSQVILQKLQDRKQLFMSIDAEGNVDQVQEKFLEAANAITASFN